MACSSIMRSPGCNGLPQWYDFTFYTDKLVANSDCRSHILSLVVHVV